MRGADTLQIAKISITEIAARFPSLRMVEDEAAPVELSVTLPVQPGLKHKVWLGLQNNDELSLGIGHFQVEWFPCTEPSKKDSYIDSVAGFLSGNYRILEHYRGTKCVKAELQQPKNGDWHTIVTWSLLWLPFPWKKTFKEVRNA